MVQFFMQGKPITSCGRFRECFSPVELLQQRELAAGFIYQHFRMLTPEAKYHSEAFYCGALRPGEIRLRRWEDYLEIDSANQSFLGEWETYKLARKHVLQQGHLIRQIWEMTRETDLPREDRDRLACILTAGCCLARVETCPLTAAQAREAYLRKPPETVDEQAFLTFPETGDICLEAREAPYRVLLGSGGRGLLAAGERIIFRRILALPHAQGNSSIPVTLMLCRGQEDPQPQTMQILAGDYRYANFIGNVPVYFHPVQQETAVCRIARRGGTIYFDAKGAVKPYSCAGIGIVGLVAEEKMPGFLLLTEGEMDLSQSSYRYASQLPTKGIVQAAFRGSECLLLDHYGRVYSHLEQGFTGDRVASLEEYLQTQEVENG